MRNAGLYLLFAVTISILMFSCLHALQPYLRDQTSWCLGGRTLSGRPPRCYLLSGRTLSGRTLSCPLSGRTLSVTLRPTRSSFQYVSPTNMTFPLSIHATLSVTMHICITCTILKVESLLYVHHDNGHVCIWSEQSKRWFIKPLANLGAYCRVAGVDMSFLAFDGKESVWNWKLVFQCWTKLQSKPTCCDLWFCYLFFFFNRVSPKI